MGSELGTGNVRGKRVYNRTQSLAMSCSDSRVHLAHALNSVHIP
jgi:carbonic anhydrase